MNCGDNTDTPSVRKRRAELLIISHLSDSREAAIPIALHWSGSASKAVFSAALNLKVPGKVDYFYKRVILM